MSGRNILLICTLLIIILICSIAIYAKGSGAEYDERQKASRGKAYKYGFITLMIFFVLSELLSIYIGRDWSTHGTNLSLGVCLSILTFALSCVFMDAYVGIKQQIKNVWLPLVFVGIVNIVIGISVLRKSEWKLIINEQLDLPINLTCGITVVIVAIAVVIKHIYDKREA